MSEKRVSLGFYSNNFSNRSTRIDLCNIYLQFQAHLDQSDSASGFRTAFQCTNQCNLKKHFRRQFSYWKLLWKNYVFRYCRRNQRLKKKINKFPWVKVKKEKNCSLILLYTVRKFFAMHLIVKISLTYSTVCTVSNCTVMVNNNVCVNHCYNNKLIQYNFVNCLFMKLFYWHVVYSILTSFNFTIAVTMITNRLHCVDQFNAAETNCPLIQTYFFAIFRRIYKTYYQCH